MYVKSSLFSYFSFFLFVFQRNSKNCFLVVRRATTSDASSRRGWFSQSATRDHHHPSYRRLTKAVSEFDALRLRRSSFTFGRFLAVETSTNETTNERFFPANFILLAAAKVALLGAFSYGSGGAYYYYRWIGWIYG